MKIAQIAPLIEAVPPPLYGGTERVVSFLTEELVRQGHEVTLFASGDSITTARLISVVPRALRLEGMTRDPVPAHFLMLDEVRRRSAQFDIVHSHVDLLHFPFLHALSNKVLTTLHLRLDSDLLNRLYSRFSGFPLAAVSEDQRRCMPEASWVGTVHHGIPALMLTPQAFRGEGYLAFLGRTSPEKGLDRAVAIAKRLGMKLKVAAKVDPVEQVHFEHCIQPLMGDPIVEFLGEINDADKEIFLGRASALLFPISWPEPFGLVMIEAMACGTPVVAFRHGAVSEVVEDGITGFIVECVDQAVNAVRWAVRLDRRKIRECFERRFTAERMANAYLAIYRRLLQPVSPRVVSPAKRVNLEQRLSEPLADQPD